MTGCSSLSYLNCMDNNISYLDVSDNPALVNLYCYDNDLSHIDLSHNTNLEVLFTGLDDYYGGLGNPLSSLDVSKCLKLKDLSCTANNLSYLDLSNNVLLESLSCKENRFGKILLPVNNRIASYDIRSIEYEYGADVIEYVQ